MIKTNKKVLVIAAHPDDEMLCAGSLFKLKEKGFGVSEIILTGGGEGGDSEERKGEMLRASEYLGMEEVFFLDQEDLGLTYSKELMIKVMGIVREVRPTIVFLMNKNDFHPDHRVSFEIGIEAVKWAATGIRTDLGESYRVKMPLMMGGMMPTRPDLIVDVTKFAKEKMAMFALHKSQNSKELVDFGEATMTVYGYQSKSGEDTKGEPFEFCPEFPASGLVEI